MDESPHQPGQVISPQLTEVPNSSEPGTPEPQRPAEQPEQKPNLLVEPGAVSSSEAPVQEAVAPNFSPVPEEGNASNGQDPGWQFSSEDSGSVKPVLAPGDDITWTASEFITHEKSVGWYVVLALVMAVITVGIYFITSRNLFSTVVTALVGIMFGVFAAQKPKTLPYALSSVGLHVGEKTYQFQEFKSFSLAEEGAIISVVFMPLKRFAPALTIYLAPDVEDRVVDALSQFLPMENHRRDAVDGLLKRIRF